MEMEFAALIYIVFIVIGALIGDRFRGRALAGLLWGMFLGPLGWLMVVLGPDHRKPQFVPCPHCGAKVPTGDPECPHCHERVLWLKYKAIRPARSVPGQQITSA